MVDSLQAASGEAQCCTLLLMLNLYRRLLYPIEISRFIRSACLHVQFHWTKPWTIYPIFTQVYKLNLHPNYMYLHLFAALASGTTAGSDATWSTSTTSFTARRNRSRCRCPSWPPSGPRKWTSRRARKRWVRDRQNDDAWGIEGAFDYTGWPWRCGTSTRFGANVTTVQTQFGDFAWPAWAVASCSSGPKAKLIATEYRNQGDGSPCTSP